MGEINRGSPADEEETNPDSTGRPSDEPIGSEYSEEIFYSALSHEVRRKIIKIVGNSETETASFSQIKTELGTSTGTVYHHLDVLKPLLGQDDNKQYCLTSLGRYAYNIMAHNHLGIEAHQPKRKNESQTKLEYYLRTLPFRLFRAHFQDPKLGTIFTIGCLGLIASLCAVSGMNSSFFFFFSVENYEVLSVGLRLWLFARFWFSVLAFGGIIELVSRFVFKISENFIYFLESLGYSFFPMLLYLIWRAVTVLWMPWELFVIFDKVVLILFQVFSILLLATSLQVFKFLKLEQALTITLLIHYFSFSVLLVELI